MLSLVLRGKLAITEDVLTAAVFDALAESRDVALLESIMKTARGLGSSFAAPAHDSLAIELWPRTSVGEPDVRIHLLRGGVPVATVLVESKLWSGKSGGAGLGIADEPRDQLARYLLDEIENDPSTVLLYLTHHLVLPEEDLAESVRCLEAAGRADLAPRLLWSSWRHVERELARTAERSPSYGRVRDVVRRVRMFWLEGMDISARLTIDGPPMFYRTNPVTYRWSSSGQPRDVRWRYVANQAGDDKADMPAAHVYVWPHAGPRGAVSFYRGADDAK